MVFSNLQVHEKDAFFSLLDEYFQSRPEIFANASHSDDTGSITRNPQAAAMSAVHRAMANNPEATAKVVSAGLRHATNTPRTGVATGSGGGAASDNDVNSVAGRVAAASLAFSSQRNASPSASNAHASPPSIAEKPSSNLTSVKKFGEVDTSSAKNFFGSLRNSNSSGPPPPPSVAPAFTPRQNNFGPPPMRRAASNVSARAITPEPAPAPPPPAPRYQARQQEEEEETGDWAEVLYEYDSGEASDLRITEGQRVLVTERTSDDWWTGEVNGKKGLFPASYVKLL
ncbi:hypothetical protein B0H34DRAFT_648154 [Crassisporium funariophilum]|nr:hypothetical protein B0H34DRAFT_648154 [Crassisporium funariophilum]